MAHQERETVSDVLVVGGGFAGLSAALYLARGFKRVAVSEGGPPRNAPAHASHGLLTRDGENPLELLRTAQRQLDAYGVPRLPSEVTSITGRDGAFTATLSDGTNVRARKILLATGVRDVFPDIPGLKELWGASVHHCPYCYGWEIRGEPIAVYLPTPMAFLGAFYFGKVSEHLVLCTDGLAPLTDQQREYLQARGVRLIESPLREVEDLPSGGLRLHFQNGVTEERTALYFVPPRVQRSDLAQKLGCEVKEQVVTVNEQYMTTVPGVYAAGDMTAGDGHLVVNALASGAKAALMLNMALLEESLADAPRPGPVVS